MVGQTLFVDPVNGDDLTAQRERLDLPYESIPAAVAAMLDGDEIVLLPGTHVVAATINLPLLANLAIVSWGGRSVTTITPPAATPLFSRTTGLPGAERWRFAGFTATGSSSYTFDMGDVSVDRFVADGALLEIEDVTMDALRMRRVGRARITNCLIDSASQVIGCGEVTLQTSRFQELALWFRNAGNNYQTTLGRLAYRIIACEVTDLMDVRGAPALYVDRSTTVQELQANVGTSFLTPMLSLQGSFGVSLDNQFTGGVGAAGTALSIIFSADDFLIEAGFRPGLDLSYAHIYGSTTIVLNGNPLLPFDPTFFMVGGNHARMLGDLTVSAPNAVLAPFYIDFRQSEFLPTSLLITTGAEVDLTGASYNELNINAIGALGAYYRKRAPTGNSPIDITGGGTTGSDPFTAPFASAILGPTTVLPSGSGDTLASQPMALTASLTGVSYEVTSDVGNLSLFGDTH